MIEVNECILDVIGHWEGDWLLFVIPVKVYSAEELAFPMNCEWVYDNLEDLQSFILNGYPQKVNENRNIVYIYVAYCFADTAVLLVILVVIFIYKLRERQAMKLAQVEFLIWIIIGMFVDTIVILVYVAHF
jgi:hypothetical protein